MDNSSNHRKSSSTSHKNQNNDNNESSNNKKQQHQKDNRNGNIADSVDKKDELHDKESHLVNALQVNEVLNTVILISMATFFFKGGN